MQSENKLILIINLNCKEQKMQSRFRMVTLVLAVIMIAAMASSLLAVPAKPKPVKLTQPDGSSFMATLKGDEHFHFAETSDGFSIMVDKSGWWTYATQENGLLVTSSYIVGKVDCPFKAHLRPSADAVAGLSSNASKIINVPVETRHKWSTDALYGVGGTKENPAKAASGRQYLNIVLGDFSDSTFAWYSATEKAGQNPYTPFPYDHVASNHNTANANWFNFLVFGDSTSPYVPDSTCVGSMTNFYYDMTYKKAWWYGVVAGPIATTVARASAVSNDAPSSTYYNAALSNANAVVNYDQNGDGVADNLMLVHPGPGQDESGDTKDIWSMSMTGTFGTYDGVTINKLIAVAQNGQLGVFSHEMFHQIGGPDLYDYGYSGTPWGQWSLMDNGSWNGILYGGDAPSFPGGHLQYDIDGSLTNGIDGWLNNVGYTDSISSLYRGDGKYTIASLDSAGEARRGNITSGIRLWRIRNNAFRDSGQIYFVELRTTTTPYEYALGESGLIITHIDTRMGTGSRFNDGPPQVKYYYSFVEQPGFDPNLLYAAGDTNIARNWYIANAAYSADDFSPGGYVENKIDSLTVPNCKTNKGAGNGNGNGPWIYDISREGPTMTFSVARTGLAASVPVVGYVSTIIKDPVTTGTANNNNSLIDPWETDSVKVNFLNTGAAITAGAQCSLFVASSPVYATVTAGWKTIGSGTMATNAEGLSAPFIVNIAKDVPRFTDIIFGVKIKSTTPSYTSTSYFSLRVSALNVVQVYDFQNIRVGGTTYMYKIQPSDVAIYQDTLYVANANLNFTTPQNRIYKVKKNTTNNPLVGGAGGDTLGSLNNLGSANGGGYICGIDVDNSGRLWWSVADSVLNTNRTNSAPVKFTAPNVTWGGDGTYYRRIRGLGFGPSVVDTVGPDPIPGDSLMVYWQQLGINSNDGGTDSIWNLRKVTSGTSVVNKRYALYDSGWGAYDHGFGYNAWNGRAIEYDGSNFWTTATDMNLIIRRNAVDGSIIEIMPGVSNGGGIAIYGLGVEAVNSAGVPYAPTGTATYVPYASGNSFYLYAVPMDEGKVYKVDITGFMRPTPPDSVKPTVIDATHNKIKWFKANAPQQKIYKYIVYRRNDSLPVTSTDSIGTVVSKYGNTVDSFIDASAKASHVYTIRSVNYYGYGDWGASVSADLTPTPGSVELTSFTFAIGSENAIRLNWMTASELDNVAWEIERSTDNENFAKVGEIKVDGANQYGAKYSYTDVAPSAGLYYYRIADVSLSGAKTYHGPISVFVGRPTIYALAQNYPNPVSTSATTIKYALKNPGSTSLKIFNLLGEEVKTLVNAKQDANFYSVYWDGKDNSGREVSNGVYFYKLSSGNFTATKKMMVLR